MSSSRHPHWQPASTPRVARAPGRVRATVVRLAGAALIALAAPAPAPAQTFVFAMDEALGIPVPSRRPPKAARRDSGPMTVKERADRDRGYRIVVSLDDRLLWVIQGADTLMEAPVAVGSGIKLTHLRRSWVFETPKGVRTVQRKLVDPVWTPPDWMYVETAQEYGLRVEHLSGSRPYKLSDGGKLVVKGGIVRVVGPDSTWIPPLDEHIVFDNILFIPPVGTQNRRVEGELGRFALDTGDGYMLHGTRFEDTVGQKASHGCLRLRDDDIAWLYEFVPVGTRVYLY
jgi:lipoprotein-anchoring transpeptidase ErfK/SrfK